MALCNSCSAPLQANIQTCAYCNVRNDLDLHSFSAIQKAKPEQERTCPECAIPLHSLNLNIDGDFFIEHCHQCFGIFCDKGETEVLLDHGTSGHHEINHEKITNITQDRFQRTATRYRKCPVCAEFMKRKNFAYRSGVIIDQCQNHGIWLDNGELVHLLEWKKAGGQMANEQKKSSAADTATQASAKKSNTTHSNYDRYSRRSGHNGRSGGSGRNESYEVEDLIGDAISSVFKIFS